MFEIIFKHIYFPRVVNLHFLRSSFSFRRSSISCEAPLTAFDDSYIEYITILRENPYIASSRDSNNRILILMFHKVIYSNKE